MIPEKSLPQHARAPFVLTAHEAKSPALTALNVPVGMLLSWPAELLPQHINVPELRIPHVCTLPVSSATPRKLPGGEFVWPDSFRPQHVVVPVLLTPQTWLSPALRSTN